MNFRKLAVLIVGTVALLYAAATVPSIYVRFALPGDAALRAARPIVVDEPLTLTVDSKGVPHLGIDLSKTVLICCGINTVPPTAPGTARLVGPDNNR